MSAASSLYSAVYDAADDEFFSVKTDFVPMESTITTESDESFEGKKTDGSHVVSVEQHKDETTDIVDIDRSEKLREKLLAKVEETKMMEQREAEDIKRLKKAASEATLTSMILAVKYNEEEKKKSDKSLKALEEEYSSFQFTKDHEFGRMGELGRKINLEKGENLRRKFICLDSEDLVERLKREYVETWGEEFQIKSQPPALESKQKAQTSKKQFKSMLCDDSVSALATSDSSKTATFAFTAGSNFSESSKTVTPDGEVMTQTSFIRKLRPPSDRHCKIVPDTHFSDGDTLDILMRKMKNGTEKEINGYYDSIDLKCTNLSLEELELKIKKKLDERKALKLKLEAEKEEEAFLSKSLHEEPSDKYKNLLRPLLKDGETVTEEPPKERTKTLFKEILKQTIINPMKKLIEYINHIDDYHMSEEYFKVNGEIKAIFQRESMPVKIYYHKNSDPNEITGKYPKTISSYSETYRVVNPGKYERNCKMALLNPLEFKDVTFSSLNYQDSKTFEPCIFMEKSRIAVTSAEVLSSLVSCLKGKGEWV